MLDTVKFENGALHITSIEDNITEPIVIRYADIDMVQLFNGMSGRKIVTLTLKRGTFGEYQVYNLRKSTDDATIRLHKQLAKILFKRLLNNISASIRHQRTF